METQCGPYNMKALDAGSPRVEDQHIPLLVTDNLKDMRMSAYEQIRMIFIYELQCPGVIPSGITAYVDHEHLHSFALEEAVQHAISRQPAQGTP